jgi:hypothetical protein
MSKNKSIALSMQVFVIVLLCSITVFAQTKVPAPNEILGFTPGDDRKLASWVQIVEYFQKLDAASDRVMFEEIGKSTMDKPFVFATISSPANLKNLAKYKEINAKLADPRLIKSNQKLADELIKQGKTIVLITCGIHSTEVGSTLSSMLIAEKLAKSDDAETKKILENTIILLVPSLNPDGVDIVKNWYDKTLGTPFEGTAPPELYHKYVGHDNNRDWYAFTQIETQLTVEKIHNEWHPQIVHDIHQQGANGARMFVPPYLPPVEPNVPKEIIEGFTELGSFIAKDLRAKGFAGITTNSTYDAWTPARAYSHYHGGVRILSETASAKLATPINIKFEDLRVPADDGYNPQKESPNFAPVWKGGTWRLRDITNYMTTASFSLLNHAADNRAKWLARFYAIGKEAVRPRKDGELFAFILPFDTKSYEQREKLIKEGKYEDNLSFDFIKRREKLIKILERGGVEVEKPNTFKANGKNYPKGTAVISLSQPYAGFAKTLLEKQIYPNLKDATDNPIPPYDVTAHTLSLLMNVEVEETNSPYEKGSGGSGEGRGFGYGCSHPSTYLIYRSSIPVMDEGWTRWVFMGSLDYQIKCGKFDTVTDKEIRNGKLDYSPTIIFPDQSPNQILNGFAKGAMPDEYTGGIGKEGVANLRKFVEDGGTLVFLNRASNFAIKEFGLPVRDVTEGLPRKDFYIPGSILRTEIDTNHKIAKQMPKESIAWFENSPVFEITMSDDTNVEIIARYPNDANKILLSGWALGAEKIAGKAALVSINIGKGKIVLFGFRPQYRGQSLATFPLLFNAIVN